MRIIAGKHRSRILKTLDGKNTRPMMDRMKESVFNTIGPYFEGGTSLDLFGGSGALSLESISRGIEKAYIVELARDAFNVIKSNISTLKEENSTVLMNTDYKVALKNLKGMKFDLIFLDPPYHMNIINEILDYLIEEDITKAYKNIRQCGNAEAESNAQWWIFMYGLTNSKMKNNKNMQKICND